MARRSPTRTKAASPHRPYATIRAPAPDEPSATPGAAWWTEPASGLVPPFVRLIGWTFAFAGFGSLVVSLGGALFLFGNLDRIVPDPPLRLGLIAGFSAAVPLAVLAAVAGLNLLLLREWARRATLAVSALGLFLALLSVATAYFGGLFDGFRLAPPWLVGLAVGACATLAVFFAWTIPSLTHPQTMALFRQARPRAPRPTAPFST